MPKLSELSLTSEHKVVLQFVQKDGKDVAEPIHVNGKGPPKGALTVYYRPWYADSEYYAALDTLSKDGRWYDTWVESITRRVIRWDLQDNSGAEIPLTVAALKKIPTHLLVLIDKAIEEQVMPSKSVDSEASSVAD